MSLCGLHSPLSLLCRPKPWMSMTRQALSHASPSVRTPANQTFSHRLSPDRSSCHKDAPAAARSHASCHQHQSSSSDATPYSEGLFGRQQAAKRHHVPLDVTAAPLTTQQASLISTPAAQQRNASIQSSKPILDALDRFNARHGKRSSSSPGLLQPAQQPMDALDCFNARKGFSQQTCALRQAAEPSSTVTLTGEGQTVPTSRGMLSQSPLPSSARQQPSQSARPDAPPHQQAQRPMDALDRFNRRKGVKPSSRKPAREDSPTAELHPRLHAHASEAAQQPLHSSSSLHRCKRLQSVASHHAADGQDIMAEDSQLSQSTSLGSQHASDLRAARPAPSLTEGFTATHTPDALDRVNSILLARRRAWTDVPAAETRVASSSPDATVSSRPARPAGVRLASQPRGMSIDVVEHFSVGAMRHGGAVPSGLYSSSTVHRPSTADRLLNARASVASQVSGPVKTMPLVKKRMRAFDNDDETSADDIAPRKKANMASAVGGLHTGHTSLGHTQQRGVFMRLAQ